VSDEVDGAPDDQPRSGQGPSRRGFLTGTVTTGGVGVMLAGWNPTGGAEPAKGGAVVNPRLFTFVGGKAGGWSVVEARAVVGDPLPAVEKLAIVPGAVSVLPDGAKWVLRGVTSNERYATRAEKDQLVKKQVALGRPEATHAALIPIRKSAKWWALTQDERRAIFEDRSNHTKTGLKYLPAVARRLHHCRDLGESEPFDFLTLFDYAKADATAFDDLLAALRATEEWKFVEREVDIRLLRADA
jgi:Chlorite dismutase